MEKQELLRNIRASLERGVISRSDLIELSDVAVPLDGKAEEGRAGHLGISEILYYLGGLIVFVGIAIFIGERWRVLPDTVKVLATLGAGITLYVSAILLAQYKNLRRPAVGLHLAAALLIPGGIFLSLDIAGISITLGIISLVFAALLAFYLATFAAYRENLFLFLSILFGTAFYFAFTEYIAQGRLSLLNMDFNLYRGLIAGAAYMFFGYQFSRDPKRAPSLVGFLNSIGTIIALGVAYALMGSGSDKNAFWELIYPALALGIIFLSIKVKSRAYLIFGTLFLMGYIFKITADYFSDNLGWSLSLVLLGFIFIGIGYLSFMLNRKYLQKA